MTTALSSSAGRTPSRPNAPRTVADRTVAWVVSLFAATVLLQRLSLPGGIVPLLLPVIYLWCAAGLATGVLAFQPTRLRLFALAGAATAAVAFLQLRFVTVPLISVTSWGLFLAVWLPAVVVLVDRSRATVLRAFAGSVTVGLWLAVVCIVMQLTQLAGLPYVDFVAVVVPEQLLVQGYVITYPIEYASDVYRSNAWIGLEPSVVSLQLGVALVLAILLRRRFLVLFTLFLGMATTVSGSGVLVVAIALLVMLLMPIRRQLLRYTLGGLVALGLVLLLPVGQQLAARATEATFSGSSTALRAIEPYRFLWPIWSPDTMAVLWGRGAGASQQMVTDTNRAGLLVPSPVKVIFDYGVVAGLLLAVFLLFCYVGGPSRSLAVALVVSSWVIQPGTTTVVLVAPTLLFITWWAPRLGQPVESDPLLPKEAPP